jgi:autoinducer 2-degrading protein
MAKQAVVVKYQVRPGQMEAFLPILRAHVKRTRATDPGCLQFDILIPHREADIVRLHEVYADEAILDAHNASEGLAAYKAASEPFLLERSISWCSVAE